VLLPLTLTGYHQPMSLQADTTADLWRQFQQYLRAQPGASSAVRYSVQLYKPGYFAAFNPATIFEKWAAVVATESLPGLETLELPSGLYAVFGYCGPASAAPAVFGYIVGTWLPSSHYALDERPHFEKLPPGYRPDSPSAQEEIWVPVRH
jgi:AraC family transcriptional regulator